MERVGAQADRVVAEHERVGFLSWDGADLGRKVEWAGAEARGEGRGGIQSNVTLILQGGNGGDRERLVKLAEALAGSCSLRSR